jgi:hypothetical protein
MQRLSVILADQIEQFLKSSEIAPLSKAKLWAALPLKQRQTVYDRVYAYLERLCADQDPTWRLDLAFPEPVGMDQARKRDVEYRGERKEDVDQGERYKP